MKIKVKHVPSTEIFSCAGCVFDGDGCQYDISKKPDCRINKIYVADEPPEEAKPADTMTVHDHFMAAALQGVLAGLLADGATVPADTNADVIALHARRFADAAMKVRADAKCS